MYLVRFAYFEVTYDAKWVLHQNEALRHRTWKNLPNVWKKKMALRLVYWFTVTIREFNRSPCGRTCTEVRALQRLYFSGPSPSEGVEDGSHCRFRSILCWRHYLVPLFAPVELWRIYQTNFTLTIIIFWLIYAGIAIKLKNIRPTSTFSNVHSCYP